MSCLVISLDLEMMWGNLERWSVDGYGRTNVGQVRKVVDRLLWAQFNSSVDAHPVTTAEYST